MIFVSLLPILIFGSIVYYQARDSLITQVGERLHAASFLAISQIERSFSFSVANIESWAELDIMQEITSGDPSGVVSNMLSDYQRSWGYYSNLVVADLNGVVVAAGDTDLLGASVSEASWFTNTLASQKSNLGNLRLDPYLGGYGVAISTPVFKSDATGEMIGVLTAGFSWSELLDMVNSIKVVSNGQDEKGYALLIDRDGYIIAAPDFILLEDGGSTAQSDILRVYGRRWWPVEDPFMLQQMLSISSHRYIERGDEHLLVVNQPSNAYETLSSLGWSLLLVRDADDALKDLATIRERALLAALLAGCLIFVISVLVARRVARPILSLASWAKTLAHGDLNNKVNITSNDEIGELAISLDEMRLDIKGYMDKIYRAKERFQSLINSLDCIVWEATVNPVKLSMLSGHTDNVLGYSDIELSELMQDWGRWMHPDDVEKAREKFREAINGAQDGYIEFRAQHANGEWVWLKALLSVAIENGCVVGVRGVMVDINDIIKASESLKEAHDLAVTTANNKSRFLAMVSHEIRTPMNGLLGMLDILRDTPLKKDQQQQLELAWTCGKNLLALVNDVMDFTRVEEGDIEFHYEHVTLQDLLHDQVSVIAVDAYGKGLDIGVVVEANMPYQITLDAVKVRQVLAILLSNAVKFTSHGSVLVWAEMLSSGRLYVEVKDTGIGIPSDDQEYIFQPFVQEDDSTTRRFEGSGLGLALARRIIEAMGGTIGVKSIQGVGTSFYFELPVVGEQLQHEVLEDERERLRKAGGADGAVLLIGDLPATKTVLQIACQQWGLEFDWEAKETIVVRNLEQVLSRKQYHWVFIAQEMSDRFWATINPYLAANRQTRLIQLRLPQEKYGQRPLPHLYVPFNRERLLRCM
ncbi:MAG: hypothetical protein CSA49_06305, partial [Gammaproteobacteria bacterium]